MFWMTGSSMSVWTIMICVAFMLNPLKSIFAVNQGKINHQISSFTLAFTPFENKNINLLLPKLTFVFFNAVILAAAIYKFSVMGIIPVAPYDWVGLINSKVPLEHNQVVVMNS